MFSPGSECIPRCLLEVPQQQMVGQPAARGLRVVDDPTQLRLVQKELILSLRKTGGKHLSLHGGNYSVSKTQTRRRHHYDIAIQSLYTESTTVQSLYMYYCIL